MPSSLISTINTFTANTALQPHCITLNLPDYPIRIQSNSSVLLATLAAYFKSIVVDDADKSQALNALDVVVYQHPPFSEDEKTWTDWTREANKSGRKDAIYDLPNKVERLVYKVKTGMLFWQRTKQPLAIGPVEQHPNQIINFVLTQYLNVHIQQGWTLGHAAGLQLKNKGIAIAGLSGGGKSTLMLHLLEQGEHFISNDRLLFAKTSENKAKNSSKSTRPGSFLRMRGIPKHPRINPGTIIHNPRLSHLIDNERQKELLALPSNELRALEEKYDANVSDLYHQDCYQTESPLDAIIILNWQANSATPTTLTKTTLNQKPELLPAIVKSPGPFYADAEHTFLANATLPDNQAYLAVLGEVTCFELTGNIDFATAVRLVVEAIESC